MTGGLGPLSGRAQKNARLLVRIRALHADHDGVVGSPRIWEDPHYAGGSDEAVTGWHA